MKRLEALEGLRGYAAFLVFLVHSCGLVLAAAYRLDPDHLSLAETSGPAKVLMFFFRSHYGVDLFFVLSGLLMADIAARRWPGTRAFLARRALRIYPAYLGAGLLALAAGLWILGHEITASQLAANAAVLQGFFVLGIAPVNPVTWSLSYEVAFYLAVPLLALAWGSRPPQARERESAWMLAGAFVAVIVASAAAPFDKAIYFAYFALFVPGLWLGMMDADARSRAAKRLPAVVAIGAWIAFTLAVKLGFVSNRQPAYYVLSAIACGLVVLKTCDAASFPARALATRPAAALGRISYSFFLVHYIVLHVLGHLLIGLGVSSPGVYAAALFAGGFPLSVIAAWALFFAAERFYFTRR
jgi:peptidoglycan/LPS O-acetylase OafA/YrhL